MGWSWDYLQNTPVYVQRVCADLMMIRRQAEADAANKARSGPGGSGPWPQN